MYSYQNLCEILRDAVLSTPSSDYEIKPISQFYDVHDLLGKVEYKFKTQMKLAKMDADLLTTFCVGCCPIDRFNGKELLGVFKEIFSSKKFLPGNYLCFSANRILVAGILQLKDNMIEITTTPLLSMSAKKFRYIFSKLFDDDEVDKRKKSSSNSFYTKEIIESLRDQAKNLYPKFLSLSVAQFLSLPDEENVFFYSFIGLIASVVFADSDKEPIKRVCSEFCYILFCALTKLAFDTNQSGQITKLLGEIGWQEGLSKEERNKKKAKCSLQTAKSIITK